MKKNIKKTKNKGTLEKVLSREAPLIAIEGWYAGQVQKNQKFFGFKFPENLYVFRNGNVGSYRDTKYLNEKLPFLISKWVKRNSLKMKKAGALEYDALVLANKILAKKKINQKEAFLLLKKMVTSFAEGFPGMIVSYWIPIWQESKAEAELFDRKTFELALYLRKKTEKFFDRSVEAIFYLLNTIGEANGWDKDILNFISLKELERSLKLGKVINEKEIRARKDKGILYSQSKILYKKDIKPFLRKSNLIIKDEANRKNISEITGTIANKGKAKGKVKVVFSRDQLGGVMAGDVLVAPMTTPWYLPAIKKSAAIITDEGGITCHAAIISRELNKPCITSTKIATKFLKDGDVVEVDANKGIIRLIKK